MMIEVYIDGSSKGNPGPGGAGIVITDAVHTRRHSASTESHCGYVTNNQAEFLALKHALIELKRQRLSSEHLSNILTDSQLGCRDLLPELESQGKSGAGNGDQGSTQGVSAANLRLRQGAQRKPG